MSLFFRLHVLANTEDNSDTGDIELIRHLHVNVSSLKILLQGTTFVIIVSISISIISKQLKETFEFLEADSFFYWNEMFLIRINFS